MFTFNAIKITSKKDFNFFVENKKQFLNTNKEALFGKYAILKKEAWNGSVKEYENFRDEYNDLIHSILIDVIANYRKFLPEKCLIVQFGSFAKRTERIFSDFDLTICYDEFKKSQYEVAEELINYSLASIFGFSIDHIHGKFQHYPELPEVYAYTEKDNHYRLIFEDGVIDYKCTETLNENLMHIKNVRDYHSMITGYEEKYKYRCDIDCLYSIDVLENTTEHDFIGDLAALEKKYDIFDGYIFDLNNFTLNDDFQVSELKKVMKHKGIVEFYIYIAMLRKKIEFSETYSMNVSSLWNNHIILSYFGKEYVCLLQKAFVEFIFFFNRIEISLNKRNIPLSTRCYEIFTKKSIDKLLAEDWGSSTSINKVIDSRNKLISIIQEGLIILKERDG